VSGGGSKLNEILVEAASFGGQKQKTSSAKKETLKNISAESRKRS